MASGKRSYHSHLLAGKGKGEFSFARAHRDQTKEASRTAGAELPTAVAKEVQMEQAEDADDEAATFALPAQACAEKESSDKIVEQVTEDVAVEHCSGEHANMTLAFVSPGFSGVEVPGWELQKYMHSNLIFAFLVRLRQTSRRLPIPRLTV
jgi:hypothetical protein